MEFAGGAIDALALCEGLVLRTAAPDAHAFGIAQVRRRIATKRLSLEHLVFAPLAARPVLLGLVWLNNPTREPVRVDYTELWDVHGTQYTSAAGACSRLGAQGPLVLADLGLAVRAQPPEEPAAQGLALDVRLVVPAGAVRQLSFAYAAAPLGENPALLVRAWRGEVARELERTVRGFLERLPPGLDPVAAYREHVATFWS